MFLKILSIWLVAQIFSVCCGQRIKDQIYAPVRGSNACFRRMNGTHQFGCTSKRGGSVGVIHYCENDSDLRFILDQGIAEPYVPLMPTKMFNRESLILMKNSGKVDGVILFNDKTKLSHFSHEDQCPNRYSSVENSCPADSMWNPKGTRLLLDSIPFPVFYIDDANHIKDSIECFQKHNNFSFQTQNDRPLCAVQLSSFMYGTTDTPTCIRRSDSVTNLNPPKFCDPLGDQNVWSSLFPLVNNENKPNHFKYIIISARLDTTSFFDKTAGAQSPITGLVALLSTAKMLKELLPTNENFENNVLFILFNGESYDYIGSQRFLYEMLKNNFPTKNLNEKSNLPQIKIDDIVLFIEFSQLSNSGNVVSHYLYAGEKINEFNKKLSKNRDKLNVIESKGTLPPASLHTFIKNQTKFQGIVLADHTNAYTNQFYNSIYDNSSNIQFNYYNITNNEVIPENSVQKWIGNITEIVAKSIYEEITNKNYNGTVKADLDFINELFYCFLKNSSCRVYKAIQKMKLPEQPQNLYVGVDFVSNLFTSLVGLTLSWVTATDIGKGDGNCTNYPRNYAFKYYNMSKSLNDLNTTRCYRVSMNFTEAVSPAFIIKDYDWSSGIYSSWTESTWGDINIRIFLKPSKIHERITIAIGSIVLIFSFLLTYFVKSRSDILFKPCIPSIAPTNC